VRQPSKDNLARNKACAHQPCIPCMHVQMQLLPSPLTLTLMLA
jgi:hypothetical protein